MNNKLSMRAWVWRKHRTDPQGALQLPIRPLYRVLLLEELEDPGHGIRPSRQRSRQGVEAIPESSLLEARLIPAVLQAHGLAVVDLQCHLQEAPLGIPPAYRFDRGLDFLRVAPRGASHLGLKSLDRRLQLGALLRRVFCSRLTVPSLRMKRIRSE